MRASAFEILSSSPRVFGWIANEIAGSGNVIRGSSNGCASSDSVSPVSVSFSFWATPISPGPSASTFFWVFPWSHETCPMRSRAPRPGFRSVESARTVPLVTRNSESLPMCGSLRVLKTSAVTGALASAARELAGDLALDRFSAHDGDRLHLDQIHEALEARLLADGKMERDQTPLEPAGEGLEGTEEVGALAVEPVDDDDAREIVLRREFPDLLGLDLDARDRVHHDDGRFHDPEPRARVGDEIAVPGRIDQVDPVTLPVAVRQRRVDRDLPLDLVGVEVGGGRAVVHAAQARHGAGGEQHGLDERRLADAAVPDDADVPDLPNLDRH